MTTYDIYEQMVCILVRSLYDLSTARQKAFRLICSQKVVILP